MNAQNQAQTLIWDLPTRVFHWLLAGSFFGAYVLSESETLRQYHVMFGYTVLALTAFRLVWGFVGSRYARFSSFLFGPSSVFRHIGGIARRQVEPHVGHTPAGSWAIYAMLILALVTGATGYLNLNEIGGDAMEEFHEVAGNLWMLVVGIHVAGVIVSSFVEKQNLPRSMVTGRKAVPAAQGIGGSHALLGALVLAVVIGFWGYTWSVSGSNLAVPAEHNETTDGGAHVDGRSGDKDD